MHSMHSWVSFSGFAESYFDWTNGTFNLVWMKEWEAIKHRGKLQTNVVHDNCQAEDLQDILV